MWKVFGRSLLLFSGALIGAPVVAQQAQPPQPGNIGPAVPRREQVEQPAPAQRPGESRVEVDARGALAQPPCALESSPLRVTLSRIQFQDPEGKPVAPELQRLLAPLAAPPSGEQPIAFVCTIRDRVNEALSAAGYVALAQIPPQEVSTGELRVTIVSARIVEVRVLGELGPFRKTLESRIEALRRLDPLNRHAAERILLLAGDIPGVDVRLALRAAGPGSRPGDVIGELSVETSRAQLLANVQNYGSHQLGPVIASLRAEAYGLTGLADRTFIAVSNSTDFDEIHVLQVGHDFALTPSGLRAAVRGSFAMSRPTIQNLDLRSRSAIGSVELSHPLLRSVRTTLGATAGLELLDQQTRIRQAGVGIPFTRDRLRVGYAQLDGESRYFTPGGDLRAILAGYAEVRQGLDILGASRRGRAMDGFSPSRADGDPQAFVLRGELRTELHLNRWLTLSGQAFGQWSNHPLLNLEEFSLGNFTYGRGYDPGANGGDRAYAFRAEPRLRLPLNLPVDVQLTGFYDVVRLFNLDAGTTERNRRLRSFGGGIRLLQAGRFVIDAVYARPLDRALSTDDRRPPGRVLVTLTTQLFPWESRR